MKYYHVLLGMFLLFGCVESQPGLFYTHQINKKHLPIEFFDKKRGIVKLEKSVGVELVGSRKEDWEVKILINKETRTGLIPKRSTKGEPILVYLKEYDERIDKGKKYCNSIQLPSNKVLTFRSRPLSEVELKEIIEDRTSDLSKRINRETAIFGIQNEVSFELLDLDYGTWQQIKIKTKHMEFEGFINKHVNGVETRKDNCI